MNKSKNDRFIHREKSCSISCNIKFCEFDEHDLALTRSRCINKFSIPKVYNFEYSAHKFTKMIAEMDKEMIANLAEEAEAEGVK